MRVITKGHRRRALRTDLQKRKPPRFRVSGVIAAITTLQEADVLDLSVEGALVEHQGMLPLGTPCFLQLEIDDQPMAVQCRVVHSRVSRKGGGGILYYQTGLQFRHLSREAEQALGALIRSYGATEG
ncbi:MAG TPA: PilZ domain-containing protein [Candidatus Methylomirabilis sp.]|nr:PilZ domain-containing protein [Candidatus Methylomirabilis sp.]